jgi:hypothetical protein
MQKGQLKSSKIEIFLAFGMIIIALFLFGLAIFGFSLGGMFRFIFLICAVALLKTASTVFDHWEKGDFTIYPLTINSTGIHSPRLQKDFGFIPWNEVRSVSRIWGLKGYSAYISIALKNSTKQTKMGESISSFLGIKHVVLDIRYDRLDNSWTADAKHVIRVMKKYLQQQPKYQLIISDKGLQSDRFKSDYDFDIIPWHAIKSASVVKSISAQDNDAYLVLHLKDVIDQKEEFGQKLSMIQAMHIVINPSYDLVEGANDSENILQAMNEHLHRQAELDFLETGFTMTVTNTVERLI